MHANYAYTNVSSKTDCIEQYYLRQENIFITFKKCQNIHACRYRNGINLKCLFPLFVERMTPNSTVQLLLQQNPCLFKLSALIALMAGIHFQPHWTKISQKMITRCDFPDKGKENKLYKHSEVKTYRLIIHLKIVLTT